MTMTKRELIKALENNGQPDDSPVLLGCCVGGWGSYHPSTGTDKFKEYTVIELRGYEDIYRSFSGDDDE